MNEPRTGPETPSAMTTADNDLMTEVREGRVEKLAVLFERYHVMLYNYFLRLTGRQAAAEDLVQDVFVRILKYRAGWHGDSRFSVWLFQIARNAHIDHWRKLKGELPLDETMPEPAGREPSPEDSYETDRDAERVRKALDLLPPRKREVLVLFRFQGLKLREIAEVTGVRLGTVKAQVHRALKDLSRIYAEMSGERP